MAQETQGRSGNASSYVEALTEQEIQELTQESFQSELESESDSEAEAEAESSPEEIVAEGLDSLEAGEASGFEAHPQLRRALVTKLVVRQMLRATLLYTRAMVKRIHRNSSLRRRLLAATRRGPKAMRAFLAPAILRSIPRPFRSSTRRMLPLVITLAFRMIARDAGLSANEADAAEAESI